MPWSTQFFSNGVAIRYDGVTTGEEIHRSKVDVFSHAFTAQPRFFLCDFTAVELFLVTPTEVDRIVDLYRRNARQFGDVWIAVVAPDALSYGLSRMWEINVETLGFRTSVVHARDEALQWLRAHGIRSLPSEVETPKRTSGPSHANSRNSGETREA